MTDQTMTELFGPVISTYTRAQALDDGCLVDVTDTASEAGFRAPVAITRGAWEDCVTWDEDDTRRQTYQDERGRLWDVLFMARIAAGRNLRTDSALYEIRRVPRGGRGRLPRRRVLKLVIGPGDAGEAVMTIMLPDED
jgi:hypothetical protein